MEKCRSQTTERQRQTADSEISIQKRRCPTPEMVLSQKNAGTPSVSGSSARNFNLTNFQWPISEDSLADISSHIQTITIDQSQKTAWQWFTSRDNHVFNEQQHSEHPSVGTTKCPWIRNRTVLCVRKKMDFCQRPGLKSADLDSSNRWQSGFQWQATAMSRGERYTQKGKMKKPVHKRCLWD